MYDVNVFQRFLNECCEKRKIMEIPPAELDSLLCNFYLTAKLNKRCPSQGKKMKNKRLKEKTGRPYDKMLIDWVRSCRMGKYLALGHGVRTSLRSVRTPWPRAKYFPVWPSHSANKYIICTWITDCPRRFNSRVRGKGKVKHIFQRKKGREEETRRTGSEAPHLTNFQ